jgi:hypothetical protein
VTRLDRVTARERPRPSPACSGNDGPIIPQRSSVPRAKQQQTPNHVDVRRVLSRSSTATTSSRGCKHVNQGKAAHRNIEGTIKAYLIKFSSASARTVTKNLRGTSRKPRRVLSNLNGTDNKDVDLDASTTNPYGKTNQTNSHRRSSQPSDTDERR